MSKERADAINVEIATEVELRYGPNLDSTCLEDNHGLSNFFIFPLPEQDLESGWVAIGGHGKDGKVQKVYMPFSEELKTRFIKDLTLMADYIADDRQTQSPSHRALSLLQNTIESTLKGVFVVGPSSIMPFN